MDDYNLRPGGLSLTKIAADAASLRESSCVLDIGCGTGVSISYLYRKYGCHVTGIDISEKAIETAAGKLKKDETIRLLTADASSLPFKENVFDLVMMECTLTLFDDPERALKEAFRVLRKDGILYISVLTRRNTGNANTAPGISASSDNEKKSALIRDGLLNRSFLISFLSEIGFSDIQCHEHNDVLVQYVADAIFSCGSLAEYIRQASESSGGCVLDCDIPAKEAGYACFLAKKDKQTDD